VFFPEEELMKIKVLPREQKREALAVFKEKLARQREALGMLRIFIERSIEFNHDVPKTKLMEWVDTFGSRYGFDPFQKLNFEHTIDAYYENRQRALNARKQFADDRELVKNLTGLQLGENEDLAASVGPMSIDIDTDALTAGKLYEKADSPTVRFQYGGFASRSAGLNPIYYSVINQDTWVRTKGFNDPTGEKTRKHEHEHHKHNLFRAMFGHILDKKKATGYAKEQDPDAKKVVLENFFSECRTIALELVKGEITASLYDRDLPNMRRQLHQLFFSGEGPYDYLGGLRRSEDFKDDQLYQETVERMLVQEYKAIIRRAVDSYAELVEKGNYSTQEATALLTDVPLEKWHKTIRRFLEYKMRSSDTGAEHAENNTDRR
jgi:hypothetical protein